MFGTIRKHQTWLWMVIITITIISFVVFFSPYSKMNTDRREAADFGSINGVTISREQFVDAMQETKLRFFFISGGHLADSTEAKQSGFDVDRDTYQWLLMLQKMNDLGIQVSSEEAAQFARMLLAPFQEKGIGTPDAFVKHVLEPQGISMTDFERFSRHFLGVQELMATVAMSGQLVTPAEGKGLYVREHEELACQAAFFSASNYLAGIAVTPSALTQFYSNRLATYRIPERVQVSYVRFDFTNYANVAATEMAKLSNLDDRINAIYTQEMRDTNFASKAKSPAEEKQKIRDDVRKEFESRAAVRSAAEFGDVLESMTNRTPAALDALAKSSNYTVKVSAPFDTREVPKEFDITAEAVNKLFNLDPVNEPFALVVGKDAAFEVALSKRIPSEVPPFEQVHARVTEDYKLAQATSMARQAGVAFYATLTNALAQGKTFEAECQAAKVAPVTIPPFSLSTRELPEIETQLQLRELKEIAFSTLPGKPSTFVPTADGGVIVFVNRKLPVSDSVVAAELPTFMKTVRSQRENDAFQDWFRKEAEKGLRDIPYLRQQQQQQRQPPSMTGGKAKT